MGKIILPKQDPNDGKYLLSYSQVSLWNDKKSFNLNVEGKLEYIRSYMFGEKYEDQGWGMFGGDVEDYICYRDKTMSELVEIDKAKIEEAKWRGREPRLIVDVFNSFTEKEKDILKTVEPLGKFQEKINIDFGDFKLIGYKDDESLDSTKIRDYKTASKSSSKKYYKDDYVQLDIYAMDTLQKTGKLPKELEVCIIERGGNCFGMTNARDVLYVKGEVWYHQRETSMDRINRIKAHIQKTAEEISEYYKVLQKVRGI